MEADYMNCLFIGGSRDGSWMEIPDSMRNVRVPVRNDPMDFDSIDFSIREELYEACRLRDAFHREYIVFRFIDDNLSVIGRLIAGYLKPKPEPKFPG